MAVGRWLHRLPPETVCLALLVGAANRDLGRCPQGAVFSWTLGTCEGKRREPKRSLAKATAVVVEERDGNEVEKRRNGTENEKKRDSTKSSPPDSLPMSTTTE